MFNANQPVRTTDASGHGVGSSAKVASGEYSLSAALTLNQVIPMVPVPTGARILDTILSTDDLDGGAGLTLDVGDGDDPDRFIAASDVGQGGGIARLGTHIGHLHRYAASDTVDVTVKAAPAAGVASGKIRLTVLYVIEG